MILARNIMKNLSVLFIILLMLSQFSLNVVSDTEKSMLYVDDDNVDGPWDGSLVHPYQHIQDALNASSDDDTVFIFNGTYTELIVIETEVALMGEDNSATIIQDTIRDTYPIIELLTISADNVTVENLCIRQHNNTNIPHNVKGIYCTESDGIIIQQNRFENCAWSIRFESSSGEILGNYMMYGQGIGRTAVSFENPTYGLNLIISNNTIINYTYGIFFDCDTSGPSQMIIDNNHMESSAGRQSSIEESGGILIYHYVDQNYQMRISHNVITGFHNGFYYKHIYYNLGSNLDDSSVDIFSNSFNNTEKDLLLYPNSRWSKETLTITKNNFFGQENGILFYELIILDPTILQYTSMIHKSIIEWNNNYWANHTADEAVRIPGRMLVWLSYRIPVDILSIPIYQTDPNPADEPFEI